MEYEKLVKTIYYIEVLNGNSPHYQEEMREAIRYSLQVLYAIKDAKQDTEKLLDVIKEVVKE